MKINRPIILAASIILTMLGRNPAAVNMQIEARPATSIDQIIPDGELLQDVTTENAVAKVLSRAHLPGGIIEVRHCAGAKRAVGNLHSFSLSHLTVRQALDLIVADDKRYKWEVQDGIVNLIPANGFPAILKTNLAHFAVGPGDIIESFGVKLFSDPTVMKSLADLGLKA